MTRRREPRTLCWTVTEAAEALRVSEHTLRDWVKGGHVRTVRWNTLDLIPGVELDRLIDDTLANGGTPPHLASASSPDSRGPAAAAESGEHGAAGPHGTGTCGEVGSNAGPSASGRPAAPTTKERAGARTPTLTTTPA